MSARRRGGRKPSGNPAGPSRNRHGRRPPGRGSVSSAKRSELGGEQVEGRHAVRELLLAGTRRCKELMVVAGRESTEGPLSELLQLAEQLKVPVREVAKSRFETQARTEAPQGVIAFAATLPEIDLDVLARPADGKLPFLLVFDGVTDPGNLGAALRSAECAGVTGAVLGRHRAARISPAAAKAAAGAIEHVPLALVPGIPNAVARLVELGVWTVGLDVAAEQSVYDLGVAPEAVALVVGSEGRGLSRLTRQRCDLVVTIPLAGVLGSLNAAAAAAVGCFEIARQRQQA